ncbi:leucyl aminopeptidase [Ramlibacter ginsenosidimutans]|uniref:Probable cytosol aminopeptidase n=1 Tax=Ramlibacter ginsenosidimutans TaxID=502333 RepID=A0A934WNB7_9BURK|nr:leucyl aminopeptidase [Ramlibacter ginsenosidimutans]MBK6007052.1 leucyl aminopeptidase [Ramlibacter ginsenosidimutans]
MEFSLTQDPLAHQRTGCIVAGVYAGRQLSPAARALDAAAGGAIARVLERGDLEGDIGTTLLLHDPPKLATQRVLLVGLGAEPEFREGSYRTALTAAMKALVATGTVQATICLHELAVAGRDSAWRIEQAVLAAMDGVYRFDQLKSHPAQVKRALDQLAFQVAEPAEKRSGEAAIQRAAAIAQGILLARDLGNMPGNLCTPTYLADQARLVGESHGMQVTILEQPEIEKLGMGAFLAVARGSLQPPRLIVMEYRGGAPGAQPIALVGKGITFDAGGISIKPAPEMDEMKFDMCGAASVFGALRAAALMKLPINVVGVIPATENMPGGNASKPGDIVTTLSGQTVEILDTDSEGRLVLCDALTYVERYRPAAVIDVATLTGEIVSALGEVATGLFSNSDALAREVLDAGERAWDRAWQMPLWDEYQEALKSNFADFPNIGSPTSCAVTAACFLSRFTKSYPWAHLDIAGTASRSGADKGATGRPVALLAHFLAARAAQTRSG